MRTPTWQQFDRAAKLLAGITWASLELALWGARPAALAFIGTVLSVSETVHFIKKNMGGDGS